MSDSASALRQRLTWFLLLRLGITTGLLGIVVLSYRNGGVDLPSGGLLLGVIGFSYFVSLLSGLLLTRVRNLAVFSYTQVVFDTLFVTGIILLTGGLDSPFPFLYHLAILNAAFLLSRRGALVAASLAALCYGGTVDLLYYGVLPYSRFGPPAFFLVNSPPGIETTFRLTTCLSSFYLVALLGSYITQRLSHVETLLAERNLAFGHLSSLYQGVIQNLESGVLIADADGIIEYANSPMGEIVGSTPSLLVGRAVNDLFASLRSGSLPTQPLEFSFPTAGDGNERTLRLVHSPLSDTYGNRIGTLYSVQDVTSVKDLERLGTQEEPETLDTFAGIVGRSEGMNKVYQLVCKVAESTSTVLIAGESGTGKELVARAIHDKGCRAGRPFVAVNCGAIPENLMESELFGHVKGAFTGAVNNRPGLFREADGGTIFLDEIGELPLALQVKLLRALQEREITPIGSNKGIKIDVRVVAATNKNLEAEVAAGQFRDDLFYRLNVISISLPPLRERTGDLPLLIHYFLARFSTESGKHIRHVSPQAMRTLLDHSYPGNIRELENIIQHAVTMAEGETIHCQDLPAHLSQLQIQDILGNTTFTDGPHLNGTHASDFFSKGISLDAELEAYEQNILRAALHKAGGIQKKAAEVLGINYRSLRHRLQKYHLS
jgi:two-component system response regulator PilR (NtrC family)